MKARPLQSESFLQPGLAFVRRHQLFLALLVTDAAAKMAAFRYLAEGESVSVFPGLRLFLALNEWGVMGGVHGMNAIAAKSSYGVALAIGLLGFALVVQRLGESSLRVGWRVLLGVTAFLAVAVAAETVALPLAHLEVPPTVLVSTLRLAVLAVTLSFYAAMRAPLARVAFALLAAGALGNTLSLFYPPYEVVDFLVLPLDRVLLLFGVTTLARGDDVAGVINLADVYLFLFPVLLLLVWPALFLAGRGRRLVRA